MENFTDKSLGETAMNKEELIKQIPVSVYAELDIITGASVTFLTVVADIENTYDRYKKAEIAAGYLNKYKAAVIATHFMKEYNGVLTVNFENLCEVLSNPNKFTPTIWRQLYLLERSIPAREGNNWTWVERLKVFVDTYSLEHAVLKKHIDGLPGTLAFTRGSGDHENLHAGAGNFATDFYCWDKELNKNHAFIEFKHWGSDNVNSAKEYYADKRYGARYVVLFMANHKYYLVDYDTNNIIEQPNLPVPELLIW